MKQKKGKINAVKGEREGVRDPSKREKKGKRLYAHTPGGENKKKKKKKKKRRKEREGGFPSDIFKMVEKRGGSSP